MERRPLTYLDFPSVFTGKAASGKVMEGSLQFGYKTPPAAEIVGPLRQNWTMGNAPLALGLIGLLVGVTALGIWLSWKVGQAFAPSEKDKKKYGWIGIGVTMIGIPTAVKLVSAIRG